MNLVFGFLRVLDDVTFTYERNTKRFLLPYHFRKDSHIFGLHLLVFILEKERANNGSGACSYRFFDIRGHERVARAFVIYGVNAISVFVGSGILARTLIYVEVGGCSLKNLLYEPVFASWLPPHAASLGYAITWVVGWFLVLTWMYRRRIFIKI